VELIRGHYNLKPRHRHCVATLGSFDGVHLGHQEVIRRTIAKAREQGLPATVITSEPLPREFFAPDTAPPRLTRLREKLAVFAQLGIDRVLCLRFNAALAGLPAEVFVENILVNGLGLAHLVVGDDTRFGKNRRGDFQLLQTLGQRFGFSAERVATFSRAGERVSSTRIREALGAGDMQTAAALLGRPYPMSGRVAHGDKRGRVLGYPTANIHLKRRQTPLMGIFAVEIGFCDSPEAGRLPGVASIGVRPTFGGGQCLLEVHLFDFDRDIYGQHVDVYFLHKLRDERRFDTVEALVAQMRVDVEQTKTYFDAKTQRRRD
jgi:riboflavin kinase/FMN adenylyltransferase